MPEPNEKLVQFPQESSRDVLTEGCTAERNRCC